MKLGIIISTTETETIWNALRLANHSITEGDEVKVFLLGAGVEYESQSTSQFNIIEQASKFIAAENAQLLACGTCLTARHKEGSELCPVSTLKDLYGLVSRSDKVITF